MRLKKTARHTCAPLKMQPLLSAPLHGPRQPKNLQHPYRSTPPDGSGYGIHGKIHTYTEDDWFITWFIMYDWLIYIGNFVKWNHKSRWKVGKPGSRRWHESSKQLKTKQTREDSLHRAWSSIPILKKKDFSKLFLNSLLSWMHCIDIILKTN